jgi:hypothetical protein
MSDDDVPKKYVDSADEMLAYTVRWIRSSEAEIEQLAAATGKRQEKTIGIHADGGGGQDLLTVHITCEPRQLAKREVTGLFAELIRKHL